MFVVRFEQNLLSTLKLNPKQHQTPVFQKTSLLAAHVRPTQPVASPNFPRKQSRINASSLKPTPTMLQVPKPSQVRLRRSPRTKRRRQTTPAPLPTCQTARVKRVMMSKFKTLLDNCLRKLLRRLTLTALAPRNMLAINITALLDQFNPFSERNPNPHTPNRYWSTHTLEQIISDADEMFEDQKYLEVYELLNRQKYSGHVDVQWRIARALYKMSRDRKLAKQVKKEMVREGLDILTASLQIEADNPHVHKWLAVLSYEKSHSEGVQATVQAYPFIIHHLTKSIALNPDDVISLYMMGKLCFELSDLSWFQRLIASTICTEPPRSSYEEAYRYFAKAEEIKPRFYVPNLYMLGRTCYHLKEFYRARYYLTIAASLPARTEYEAECAKKAKELAEKLGEYDLSKDALLSDPY